MTLLGRRTKLHSTVTGERMEGQIQLTSLFLLLVLTIQDRFTAPEAGRDSRIGGSATAKAKQV